MKYQLTLCLATAVLCSCGSRQPYAGNDQPGQYPVMTLSADNTVLNEDYPATLEGQENIEVRPKVEGFVEEVYVDEGAVVRKGQLLFRISAPQYEQEKRTAEAAIKSAEAEVGTARMQVAKVEPLVKKEIVSNYELESARLNLQAKEAILAQARAGLANAQTNIGYTTITSPVDGIVGALPYKKGSLVSGSSPQPLTTVSNIGKVYAYFSLNEKQFLNFSGSNNGATMAEKIKQFPLVHLLLPNGEAYPEKGHLETVGGLINSATGAVSFRAVFPNSAGIIRSGSSAVIRIPRAINNVLLVPQKATYEMQDKKFVFVVDGSNTVKNREIRVMDISSGDSFVVEKGLQAGEKIVTDGTGNLKEGMKIVPGNNAPSTPH